MPKTIEEVKDQLKALMPLLKSRFHVESLEIFGSYARDEQTKKSDLDLLITFSQPYDLWEFIDVKEFLAEALHINIDLVPKDSIKSMLKDRILQEATPI